MLGWRRVLCLLCIALSLTANTLPAQTAMDEYARAVRQELGRSSPLSGECVVGILLPRGCVWTASFLLVEWHTYAPVGDTVHEVTSPTGSSRSCDIRGEP